MQNNKILRQALVPLATAAVVLFNSLVNIVRLNGYATGQISDAYPNFFVPAGYVFSIWGVIYIGLITYTVYQALPKQLDNPRLQAIAPLYLLGSAANILWLTFFHFLQFPLSMVMMLVLLVSLIAVYLTLGTGRTRVSLSETWLARVPLSIYLGWITVATVANATQVLVAAKWDGFGFTGETWAAIMIGVATIVALLMFATRRDAAYLLVLAWAFAGIGVKQAAVPAVYVPAWVATTLVVLMAGTSVLYGRRGSAPTAAPAP